jgi:CubicO group peptidase (beta-lactamase class C family)
LYLTGCISDEPFKFESTTVPEPLDDGWDISAPGDEGIDPVALAEVYDLFISENHYLNAISLLIVKNGKLVYETYCRDPKDRDRFRSVQSVAKSVTSLVFGIVMSEGYIDSLDQRLYDIIPDKFPPSGFKRKITLRHLLTMTSGLDFDNDDFSVKMYSDKPVDPIHYLLRKRMYAPPGLEFCYRDVDPHLISYAIQRLTNKTLAQWAHERIFDPLMIREYYWESDYTGTTMGAHGLHLKPRDMAKIGEMVRNNGDWKGFQVVDSAWVSISTQKQVETPFRTEPYIYQYGFYWWILPRWGAYAAWGAGGNYIFVSPPQQMVIVMTSMPDVDNDIMETNLKSFEILIRPILELI